VSVETILTQSANSDWLN